MPNYPTFHYKFHQTVLDCSENTYNGTAANLTYVDGFSGKAGYFNGTSTKVETSYSYDANVGASFSVFVRFKILETKATNKWHSLVDGYAGTGASRNFQMFVNDQNKLVVYHVNDSGYTWDSQSVTAPTSAALTNNVWYNAVYSYSSSDNVGILHLDRGDNYVGYALIPAPTGSTATEIHIGSRADENADGFANAHINEVAWYNATLSDDEISRLMSSHEEFDIWIKQRTFPSLSNIKFRPSRNLVAGDFTAEIADRDGTLLSYAAYENDVMIFVNGVIKFKGKLDQIIPSKVNNIVTLKGKDYTTVLFERVIANVTYTNQTRKDIIEQIIDDYLKQSFGPVYFTYGTDSNSSIENFVATNQAQTTFEQITIEYSVTTVARALLGIMEEVNAQIIIEPSVSMPLTLRFARNTYSDSGIILDYDTRSNNTSGHKLKRFTISRDSKQIRNVFTVYGPASHAIAVAVRDENSILTYGEKRAKPIVDTSATTVALARRRAEEEMTKWNTVIEKGEFVVKLNNGYNLGDTVKISIDAESYNEVEVVLVEVEYFMKPQEVRLYGIALLGGSEDIISQVVKEMTTIDLRDADAASPVSQYLTSQLFISLKYEVTINEYTTQNTSSAIGTFTVGVAKVGNDLTTGSTTNRINSEKMIITDSGLYEYFSQFAPFGSANGYYRSAGSLIPRLVVGNGDGIFKSSMQIGLASDPEDRINNFITDEQSGVNSFLGFVEMDVAVPIDHDKVEYHFTLTDDVNINTTASPTLSDISGQAIKQIILTNEATADFSSITHASGVRVLQAINLSTPLTISNTSIFDIVVRLTIG